MLTRQIKLHQKDLVQALDSICLDESNEFDWIEIEARGTQAFFRSYTSYLTLKYEAPLLEPTPSPCLISLSSRKLSEYVRCLPPESITLVFNEGEALEIVTENSFAAFPVYLHSGERSIPSPSRVVSIKMKREVLQEWIRSFESFIKVSDIRVYLTGAFLSLGNNHPVDPKKICLSGTVSDGLTLAHVVVEDHQFEILQDGRERVLLPKKMIDRMKYISSQKSEQEFVLSWNESEMFFSLTSERFEMQGRTIIGEVQFHLPALLDEYFLGSLKVNRTDLNMKLRRILLFTDANLKTISLKFDGHDKMILNALHRNTGSAEEWIDIQSSGELPKEIFYQGSELAKVAKSFAMSEELRFCWKNGYDLLMVYTLHNPLVFPVYYLAASKLL